MSQLHVRAIASADLASWLQLYRGYRDFYQMEHDPQVFDTVWTWLMDPQHETRGLAVESEGSVIGLAHFRVFARPIVGAKGIFLDDLYVSPDARGRGAASALLTALAEVARDEQATVVRWITAADNATARKLYDRLARETPWVTYDLSPAAS